MTLYEENCVGNIAVMIDAYRAELVKGGFSEQALRLKGLEIFDLNDAKTALHTLRGMPNTSEEADSVRSYAIGMIEELLLPEQQLLAS